MVALFVCNIALKKEFQGKMTQWEKDQRFGARVAHRIKMTEKINLETKERHVAEMAAYEARIGSFKFELYPGRDEPKENKTINEKLDFFH
jgi:hypothetical protein